MADDTQFLRICLAGILLAFSLICRIENYVTTCYCGVDDCLLYYLVPYIQLDGYNDVFVPYGKAGLNLDPILSRYRSRLRRTAVWCHHGFF